MNCDHNSSESNSREAATEALYNDFINQAADSDHWNTDRVEQLAGFIRLWKNLQLLHAPSITPQQMAEALELVAAEIRRELEPS